MGNVDKITQDIGAITENLKSVFGSNESGNQMREMLANLRDITVSINELVKTNQQTVRRTLDNIDGIAADARPGIRQIVSDIKGITNNKPNANVATDIDSKSFLKMLLDRLVE